MVGLPKCKFGMTECRHLGDWWTSGGYFRPPEGKLAALVELSEDSMASMSRSKLYGMLGYWRQYVPDFSARTARLTRLLRKDAAPWGPAHTEEVRAVVKALVEAAPVINFDPASPVILEPHSGPKGIAAVFLQQDPEAERWLPVAAFSRGLAVMEFTMSAAMLELLAIQEGLRRMAHISTGAAQLMVRVSDDVLAVLSRKLHLAPGMIPPVCDILSYHPTFLT